MHKTIYDAYAKAERAKKQADAIRDNLIIKTLNKRWNSAWVARELGLTHRLVLDVMYKHKLKYYREE